MLTKEQIKERQNYLGGGDCAAVLGMSRFSTPLTVWAEKTGNIIPEDISEKLRVKLGNKLEATVADLFTEETGKILHRKNETIYHPTYKFLAANIDRRVVGERAGFEAKTTGSYSYRDWEGADEIPMEYLLQCIHYLAVTGWDKWYIACLIGNQKFVWKEIKREEKVINDLIKKEVFFWREFVEKKVMPMQITRNDEDVLSQLFPQATEGAVTELDDQANAICESLDSLKADKKVLEGEIEQQENTLRALLKDNESGKSNNWLVSWKNQMDRRVNIDALKNEQQEIYNRYLVEKVKRVLRIKKLVKDK